ncbi:DUF2911 domain-containing protein [Parafilimonas terrae]|jgi:tetratricopeptide (TPR) repeat protein|uniref:Uncharacterized protein n=1 Tax=Parafilimonas terrae TaxID=1465490 RepID=A0A1I5V8K8_9BACT|nr:DUF2911 domain-containing protein [Parafilimonas terrae]SFQ03838.1 Protein of unknown function [Parafilimonas terrae]
MKKHLLTASFIIATLYNINGQALRLPGNTNIICLTGRKVGVTEIEIHYSAPGVKGREGKIYGTNVVPFGYEVLGYGSNVASPWRAGADECTTMSFSTDVNINGKTLPAGKYAFFIDVQADSSELIFNKNTKEWGSYFYRKDLDVLHAPAIQQKNLPDLQERLVYDFSNQTDSSIDINLKWERWSFPIHVSIDLKHTVLENIREQMSGAIGFDPASLEAAAQWCVMNDTNYDEALNWINTAVDPDMGGRSSFNALSVKASLLKKLGKEQDAAAIMKTAVANASALELHFYGRQLMNEKKLKEAFDIFQQNYTKQKGAWPTNTGMMRIYSAMGDYKKALEYAKAALLQAPDDASKKFLETAIQTLQQGKPI